MDIIFNRRSIRRYKKQTVEQEKIEKLLRAAMQAPSAAINNHGNLSLFRRRKILRSFPE